MQTYHITVMTVKHTVTLQVISAVTHTIYFSFGFLNGMVQMKNGYMGTIYHLAKSKKNLWFVLLLGIMIPLYYHIYGLPGSFMVL